jgi:hypothetical protein
MFLFFYPLVGKSERDRTLARPNHGWKYNIKIDLKYDLRMRADYLSHDKVQMLDPVNTVINFQFL